MLAPGKGGIEYAFVRWTEALLALGHKVTCVVTKNAAIIPHLPEGFSIQPLRQAFEADPLAIWRLRRLMKQCPPTLVISHGNRAGRLLQRAHGGKIPHLAVLHRPRFKGLSDYSAVACVTDDLMQQAVAHGVPAKRLHHVPNFLPADMVVQPLRQKFFEPLVIGALGRFVPEKGMDQLIEAMTKPGMERFHLRIGGDGPERPMLEASIQRLGLQARVTLVGWVDNTADFYRHIDLLCVPSRSESFGLVILEGWAHGVAVVATRTSGPLEIITSGVDGVLCDGTPDALANTLKGLSKDNDLVRLAQGGQQTLQKYSMCSVQPNINALLSLLTQASDECDAGC